MFLLPFVFIVITALMTDEQALTPVDLAAARSSGATSRRVPADPFLLYTWNTTLIALLSTVGVVVSCMPVAYALSRMRWRGRQVAFLLVLSTLMLPSR